jgi:hypothetical protein
MRVPVETPRELPVRGAEDHPVAEEHCQRLAPYSAISCGMYLHTEAAAK